MKEAERGAQPLNERRRRDPRVSRCSSYPAATTTCPSRNDGGAAHRARAYTQRPRRRRVSARFRARRAAPRRAAPCRAAPRLAGDTQWHVPVLLSEKTTFLHGPLYVSVADMTDASPPNPKPNPNPDAGSDAGTDADFDDLLAFTPVPMQRRRADGWSAERQRRFITALSVMGAVGPAARAVGMGRASAYRLRERAGAAGFAEAWYIAIACGADLQFHTALDQAINGVTTVRDALRRLHAAGAVSLWPRLDDVLLLAGAEVDVVALCVGQRPQAGRLGRVGMHPHLVHRQARQRLDALAQWCRQAGASAARCSGVAARRAGGAGAG